MRSILNISLPESFKKTIKTRAVKMGKSVSAYIVYAVNIEQQLISEDEILEMGKKAKNDYQNKNTKVLKSLSDLM